MCCILYAKHKNTEKLKLKVEKNRPCKYQRNIQRKMGTLDEIDVKARHT